MAICFRNTKKHILNISYETNSTCKGNGFTLIIGSIFLTKYNILYLKEKYLTGIGFTGSRKLKMTDLSTVFFKLDVHLFYYSQLYLMHSV